MGCLTGLVKTVLAVFLVFFLAFMLLALFLPRNPGSTPNEQVSSPASLGPQGIEPGMRAALYLPGGQGLWLAANDSAYDEMLDAQNAKSMELLGRLMERGLVVRELNGTQVLVIKNAMLSRFVRVLNGSNPGFEGWVQREFVRRIAEEPAEVIRPAPRPTMDAKERKEFVDQVHPEAAEEPDRGFKSMLQEAEEAEAAKKKKDDDERQRKQSSRAVSLLASAQNLERMGKPAGALGFYRTIVKECPGTATADIAAERIKVLDRPKP